MRRRIDPRREDGVAMTEFALIVPVFMLIVVGMLVFGRLFFYWIETNHVASETARWAVVDRNPYSPRSDLQAERSRAAQPRSSRTTRPSASITRTSDLGSDADRRARRSGARARAGARHASSKFFGSGVTIKGSATMRVERIADTTSRSIRRSPILVRTFRSNAEDAREPARRKSAGDPGALGDPDPGLHRPHGDGRRRRPVVHAQAPAPEPRRLRRARSRRRVRRRTGRRAFRAADATLKASGRTDDRERGATVRRRSRGSRLRPGPLPATLYNSNIANQSNLDVVINSTTYTDDTDYSDGGGSPPAGTPCFIHAGDTSRRPAATGSTCG